MAPILTIIATLGAAYLSTFVYCFIRNFFNARKTGFPSVYVPLDQNHFVWMLTSVPLRPWLQKVLPKFIWDRVAITIYGFEFHEKTRPFEEYAKPRGNDKSYMLVVIASSMLAEASSESRSPVRTRHPEIVNQILMRTRDFTQVDVAELFMAKFGRNVLTSNGDHWVRQRKVVASTINERISKAVFNESIRQTEGMLSELEENAKGNATETTKLFDMAKKITIHVLSGAGMGASVPWKNDMAEQPKPGFKQTYIQSVKTVIHNVTGPIILPKWFLLNYPSFLPGHNFFKTLGYAIDEFPEHTKDLLEQEKQRSKENGRNGATNNIMSQLLQASENADADSQVAKGKALSDEEMIGNLFIFTAAGFDTTANTISFALVLLARYPKLHNWLLEEVDSILPADPTQELDYANIFPKAVRLMAFMLETLRLYTPIDHIARQTQVPQTIQTSQQTYWLPARTLVYTNNIAMHLNPEVWNNVNLAEGESSSEDDSSLFRPSRWINPPGSTQPLFQPPKGTFAPWSGGPRICPGQKMAQVEFVSIFLTLFRQHKIEAVHLDRESRADVDKRLDQRMRDSMNVLTLQMNNIYDVPDSSDKGLLLRVSKR